MDKAILKLLMSFKQSFVNDNGEIIVDKRNNHYFKLSTCKDELEIKCKVLEYLSRSARTSNKILQGVNEFLNVKFTKKDMERIYAVIGGGCNRERCLEFIEGRYDMYIMYQESGAK